MRQKGTKVQGWRKIAAATWGPPNSPQIFGDLEVDATEVLSFIDAARQSTGARVTVTHMVGKAVAHALERYPDLNVRIHGGRVTQRDTVDIFFIISVEQGKELSGVKVEGANEKSVVDIARELSARAAPIQTGEDVEFGKMKTMFARTPWRLLRVAFDVASRITTDFDIDLKKLGLPRQPFGSVIVSSVGMFGVQHAYAPLSRYYKIPALVLVGEVTPKPAVIEGRIEPRPLLTLSATIDHRYLDGYHAARLAAAAREYLEDPKRFEPPLPPR
jgi:pyruvate dehydrogenase E2 component (dihydrolipoamide acetyltransferase)